MKKLELINESISNDELIKLVVEHGISFTEYYSEILETGRNAKDVIEQMQNFATKHGLSLKDVYISMSHPEEISLDCQVRLLPHNPEHKKKLVNKVNEIISTKKRDMDKKFREYEKLKKLFEND